MAKMTSFRWAEKDDPMFTGGFHIHSDKLKNSRHNKVKKDMVKKPIKKQDRF